MRKKRPRWLKKRPRGFKGAPWAPYLFLPVIDHLVGPGGLVDPLEQLGLGVDVGVTLMPPCTFCMENH
jgi:hypothetical protein